MYYFNAPFWSGGGLRGGCDNSVADVGKSFESSSSSQSNNIRSSSNGSSSVVNANIDASSSPSVSSSSSSSSSSPSVSSSSSLVMSVSHGPVYFTTRPLVEVSLQQTSTKAEAGATTKADPGNRSKKTRRRQRCLHYSQRVQGVPEKSDLYFFLCLFIKTNSNSKKKKENRVIVSF